MVHLTEKYETCKHKNAFHYGQDHDDFEGRTYDLVFCPDCGSYFETRCYLGRHDYPYEKMIDHLTKRKSDGIIEE